MTEEREWQLALLDEIRKLRGELQEHVTDENRAQQQLDELSGLESLVENIAALTRAHQNQSAQLAALRASNDEIHTELGGLREELRATSDNLNKKLEGLIDGITRGAGATIAGVERARQ